MKRKLSLILVLSCLFVSSFILTCSEPKAAEILNLGATVPFQYRIGIEIKNIFLMNADVLNKAGGLNVGGKNYTIKFHIYDSKYDADVGRAAFEKLVHEDKVKFMFPFESNVSLAGVGVTEPNKVPIFSVAASEKLLNPNLKYFVHTYASKYAYGTVKGTVEKRPDIKKVLICAYDDPTGHSLSETQEKADKAFGLTVLPTLYFRRGETNFSQIAIKAVSLKPDLFHAQGVNGEAEMVQLIKALREEGFRGYILSEYITQEVLNELVARVGKEQIEGIVTGFVDPTTLPEEIRPSEAVELRKNYEKYYGKWSTEGVGWVGSWYTWLAAIKKVNSLDPDKVVAAIDRDFRVQTPIGPGKFFTRPDLGNNRYCDYSTMIVTGIVKNGKMEFFFSKDPDWGIDVIEQVYGIKMRK